MDAPEKESVHASCCIRMEEIAKSVIVRADDFQHLIENLFHLPHQCELGAGAVEVVVRAGNMEIMVALQIVGQETDAAFQRHEFGTPGKTPSFSCVHGGASSGKIAFGKYFIQMQVKVDFALVGFILGAVVGTGADGITEIISRKTRHHGVEVNDTDAFASGFIEQNIVDFGIIMGDTQRDLTSCQLIQQDMAVLLPRMDKVGMTFSVSRAGSPPSARIFARRCRVTPQTFSIRPTGLVKVSVLMRCKIKRLE